VSCFRDVVTNKPKLLLQETPLQHGVSFLDQLNAQGRAAGGMFKRSLLWDEMPQECL